MKPTKPKDPEVFVYVVDKQGHAWLFPTDVPNRGDWVFVTAFPDWNKVGEGFGGSTLQLKLRSGGYFSLRGGWHTNAHALLGATGIDLTKEHYTFITTAKYPEGEEIYYDPEWTLGDFDRDFAMEIFASLPIRQLITKYSMGGSIAKVLGGKQ